MLKARNSTFRIFSLPYTQSRLGSDEGAARGFATLDVFFFSDSGNV